MKMEVTRVVLANADKVEGVIYLVHLDRSPLPCAKTCSVAWGSVVMKCKFTAVTLNLL